MPILVVAGRGRRHTIDISGWSTTTINAVILTAECDGFTAHTGYGIKEN